MLSFDERALINKIIKDTEKGNIDNISRTVYYDQFYLRHKEIVWSYLASFVSRNAGWNMTDLEGEILGGLLPRQYREVLYLTYERANWLIFHDVYPQLLIYELSKQRKSPYFYLLKYFYVSKFMEKEWEVFWETRDSKRLCTALIINEQHVIQKPVIDDPYYHKHVFTSMPFVLEDRMHFSSVLFPTLEGELYGFSVHGFSKVKNRIELGKRLAWLLIESPEKEKFRQFASTVVHTGSRYDYEKYTRQVHRKRTPYLRSVFPIIPHHRSSNKDWYKDVSMRTINKLFQKPKTIGVYHLTDWYDKKQKQLRWALKIEQAIMSLLRKD